jgi:hypothetical protein
MKLFLFFAVSIFLMSCQRTGYLYHTKPLAPPVYYQFEHKLKEIQGESKVDILWIIDNSGSMGSYQKEVVDNAAFFMNHFIKAGMDWKMGLISTDPGVIRNYIGLDAAAPFDYKSANPVNQFQDAVKQLGVMGSGWETTFIPVREHLKVYPNFLRKDAILALLIVTDAPEQSDVPFATGIAGGSMNVKAFLNLLKTEKKSLSRVVTYGAFAATDIGCRINDGFRSYKGSSYEELVLATNGKHFPLCTKDFGTELAKFGKDLLTKIEAPRIYLKSRPILQTLKVIYRGTSLPGGMKEQGGYWVYDFDNNAIIFHDLKFAASDNEKVTVEYQLSR